MTREYITLGDSPAEEEVNYDTPDMRHRVPRVFAKMLRRMFPKAEVGVKEFQHDFGPYREAVVYFDPENEASSNIAMEVDQGVPLHWDILAKEDLFRHIEERSVSIKFKLRVVDYAEFQTWLADRCGSYLKGSVGIQEYQDDGPRTDSPGSDVVHPEPV